MYNPSLNSLTIARNLFPMTASRISAREIPRVHRIQGWRVTIKSNRLHYFSIS